MSVAELIQTDGAESAALVRFHPIDDTSRARLTVHAARRAPHRIAPLLTGKFAEHLHWNVNNGMWAQIVRNPTFAEWPFAGAGRWPDGAQMWHTDAGAIAQLIGQTATRFGWPPDVIDRLVEDRIAGLAHYWFLDAGRAGQGNQGDIAAVRPSPDAGPTGGRAQRVEVRAGNQGIAQWLYLPLHRTRRYRWRVIARSPDLPSLRLSLAVDGQLESVATAEVGALSRTWQVFTGELELSAACAAAALYRLRLTAAQPGQFVVARVLLEPDDAVSGADPDVVRLLKEARLPILRWPGGNFASAYDWEDGVGPADARPARHNPAWGGAEPNLFGTDEFVAFCRAVGCEPLICVNVGDGTPDEAARWVEYCNGPADSPMGARRAANGHPEPYHIRYWEIGNELYGWHQRFWTTGAGYADRYAEFTAAMRTVDPHIQFIACGAASLATWRGDDWNGRLLAQHDPLVRCLTDHVLIGGQIPASTDPLDVYRDFMAIPDAYEHAYRTLWAQMRAAGVPEPRLAITEMQLFGRLLPAQGGETVRLTSETLVSPPTMAEAVYSTLFYHLAVRLAPFVEIITHSATVNHGGGLRKERERVYANPCHDAHAMLAAFANATPVAVDLAAGAERVPAILPRAGELQLAGASIGIVDAIAAIAPDGALLVSLAHRGTTGPVRTQIDLRDFEPAATATVRLLSSEHPWDGNSLAAPERVAPVDSAVTVEDNRVALDLPPYSVMLVRVPPA
ncbi:MAG: hypothetical protein HY332_18715 [Chloroflexi bacterium]|nr:hypothetical protein [Chloroflexota bacterium]